MRGALFVCGEGGDQETFPSFPDCGRVCAAYDREDAVNPYQDLGPTAFWRTGVAEVAASDISGLWAPKWPIGPDSRIATAGSCFAQHFGAALRTRGYAWLNAEPAPGPLPAEARKAFHYDIFSARTGNIYTARQLLQWLEWAVDPAAMPEEAWSRDGRWFDPFRPTIEPDGFASEAELRAARRTTLAALRSAATQSDVFVFTLGLTECWRHRTLGYEYPVCPGTIAGRFDAEAHGFVNQGFAEILDDMQKVVALLRRLQPAISVLLTVSPVPLTATASGQHVLVATAHSKSILRAVAGTLAATIDHCDYFPSYEIITAPPFRAMFYAPNLRTVTNAGVRFVMDSFFAALGPQAERPAPSPNAAVAEEGDADPLCDEAALEQFAGR